MSQVLGTFTMYGDTLGDSILKWSLPLAEEVVGEELYPCYTFMRVYNNSDILDPHCDRPSCEFSATMPIHFDRKWPIHLQKHNFEKHGDDYFTPLRTEPSKSLILDLGDICFYEGTKMSVFSYLFIMLERMENIQNISLTKERNLGYRKVKKKFHQILQII